MLFSNLFLWFNSFWRLHYSLPTGDYIVRRLHGKGGTYAKGNLPREN